MDSKPEIIIIDDNFDDDEPLVLLLKEEFEKVTVFQEPQKAKKYILDNISQKIVIILDLAFPEGEINGKGILAEIRKTTKNIPIIIYTASPENERWEDFKSFFDSNVLTFFGKASSSNAEVVEKVIEATQLLDAQVGSALEEWVNLHKDDETDKPYLISKDGKSYTLNEILHEVRMQTDLGKTFEKDIIMLSIDLLARNKESLDD